MWCEAAAISVRLARPLLTRGRSPHQDAAQLVASEDGIWRHSFLSCCALPLEIVAYPVACGIFLGLDKPRAVLGISCALCAASPAAAPH